MSKEADALRFYDEARKTFLGEVKNLIAFYQREVRDSLHDGERHDYLMYAGTTLGSLADQLEAHDLVAFEQWKKEFMGGRRACESLEDC
jgi:hypothetical protein